MLCEGREVIFDLGVSDPCHPRALKVAYLIERRGVVGLALEPATLCTRGVRLKGHTHKHTTFRWHVAGGWFKFNNYRTQKPIFKL